MRTLGIKDRTALEQEQRTIASDLPVSLQGGTEVWVSSTDGKLGQTRVHGSLGNHLEQRAEPPEPRDDQQAKWTSPKPL